MVKPCINSTPYRWMRTPGSPLWMVLANIGYLAGNIKVSMTFNTETPKQQYDLFDPNSRWLKICLFVMFLLAMLVRLDEIKAPGHLLDREYTSAIFARAYYFTNNDEVEDWRRDIAIIAKDQQPVLEPPVLEYLVSLIYRVMGRDVIYYSRFLTNASWLIGGSFMFSIARKLLSTDEAEIGR